MSRLFRTAGLVPLAVLLLAVGLPAASAAPAAAATTTYTITDLGSLGYGVTGGVAINNNGQVTGRSFNGATVTLKTCCGGCYSGGPHNPCKEHIYHAFVWSNGTMTDLGLNFFPAAINDNGVIVGGTEIYSGGTLQNLNNLIPAGSPQITSAVAISDNGQIVAASGGRTLLLTPN
jgi:uncharacterized membrane protein